MHFALGGCSKPTRFISMATLDRCARVAVGPDLAPYFSDDPDFIAALETAASRQSGPGWRMPFHAPLQNRLIGNPYRRFWITAPFGRPFAAASRRPILASLCQPTALTAFRLYGWQKPAAAPGAAPKARGTGKPVRATCQFLDVPIQMTDRRSVSQPRS